VEKSILPEAAPDVGIKGTSPSSPASLDAEVDGEKIPPLPVDPACQMAKPCLGNGIKTCAEILHGEAIAFGHAQ
jgi:hypothetical protein